MLSDMANEDNDIKIISVRLLAGCCRRPRCLSLVWKMKNRFLNAVIKALDEMESKSSSTGLENGM
jgi:hypothetical protein